MSQPCVGCGGRFADMAGPTHAYMLSSSACWKRFGDVLAREYSDPALFRRSHRFTVDAYALQHPGAAGERRAVQSVWLHFTSLHLIFGHGRDAAFAQHTMQRLADPGRAWPPREPVPASFSLTVADVLNADIADHPTVAGAWALCAYQAWAHLIPGAEELIAAA